LGMQRLNAEKPAKQGFKIAQMVQGQVEPSYWGEIRFCIYLTCMTITKNYRDICNKVRKYQRLLSVLKCLDFLSETI